MRSWHPHELCAADWVMWWSLNGSCRFSSSCYGVNVLVNVRHRLVIWRNLVLFLNVTADLNYRIGKWAICWLGDGVRLQFLIALSYFSREIVVDELIFSDYFGVFLVSSPLHRVMSWYFFSCGRWDLQALGRFQLRRIYFWIFGIITEIRFRDLELWMKCLVKSMEFDLRGVIHFCRSNALWGRLPCRQAIRSYFWHVSSAHDWPSCTAFVTFYIFVNTRVSSSIV